MYVYTFFYVAALYSDSAVCKHICDGVGYYLGVSIFCMIPLVFMKTWSPTA